jgi:hypothetical protein
MMKLRHLWPALAGLLFAACGGGGSDHPVDPTPYSVGAGWRNLLTANASWTVSGHGSDGRDYTITNKLAPGATAVFPATLATASTLARTLTVQATGAAPESIDDTIYLDAVSGTLVGDAYGDGSCLSATSTAAVPQTAVAGANGPLATGPDVQPCAPGASPFVNTSLGWSLESADDVTMLCITDVALNLGDGSPLRTESDCIEVSPDGTLGTRARVRLAAGSFVLDARNF